MADPRVLIREGHLYNENDMINHAMDVLYEPDEEGLPQHIPTIHEIIEVYEEFLRPFLDPDADEGFDHTDLQGLITNIVLFDASLDPLFGLTEDLPLSYGPYALLNLIGEKVGFEPYDRNSELLSIRVQDTEDAIPTHIFHWASERLFPYFEEHLGRGFVLDSQTGNGDSYLHSYLKSCLIRIMNPDFVKDLLDLGFDLREQNADGYTPLHIIVYEGLMVHEGEVPFAHLSNEQRANPRNRQAVKRYNRFYQTLQILFAHPSADMDIPDDDGGTVRSMIEEEPLVESHPAQYIPNNVREAYNISQGRPRAIERAKKQKLARALAGNTFLRNKSMNPGPPTVPSVSRPIGSIIEEMLGTNLRKGEADVEKRVMNNTRRRKGNMLRELQSPTLNNTRRKNAMLKELLSRKNNRSGGRRTRRAHKKRRGDTSHASQTHTPLQWRRSIADRKSLISFITHPSP